MTRKDKAPVSLRIRLKYPDVETFVEKYAPNISRGGMFIQSRAPQPVGTQLRFELLIQGGVRLLKGEGRVVWIKEYDASKPMQAHGMGVRFNELDDESRATVERILAFKQRSTTEPPKIPRVRRSQTLEVRGLASLVAATEDAEEPQEARLSAEHPAVQALLAGDAAEPAAQPRQAAGAAQRSAPAPASQPDAKPSSAASVASLSARAGEMAPSNGVAVERAEQALRALIAEAGLEEAAIAAARERALSQDLDTDGIDGLEALLEAPEDEEPDAAAAREALRVMLGAPRVPDVAPLIAPPDAVAAEPSSVAKQEPAPRQANDAAPPRAAPAPTPTPVPAPAAPEPALRARALAEEDAEPATEVAGVPLMPLSDAEADDEPSTEVAGVPLMPPYGDEPFEGVRGRTADSLAVDARAAAPLSQVETPPPPPQDDDHEAWRRPQRPPTGSTSEQISLEALAAEAQSAEAAEQARYAAASEFANRAADSEIAAHGAYEAPVYDGLDDVTVPQVQRDPSSPDVFDARAEYDAHAAAREDAGAGYAARSPLDELAYAHEGPDSTEVDASPIRVVRDVQPSRREAADVPRFDASGYDEDEQLIEDEDAAFSDDTDIGYVPEVVYEEDEEPLMLDESPFDPPTEPHGQDSVPRGSASFEGQAFEGDGARTVDQPGFDESLLEAAAANIARTSRAQQAQRDEGFGETPRDEIVFASRVPDLTADVPLDEPEDAPTTQRFEADRHLRDQSFRDPRLQQLPRLRRDENGALRSVSTDELVDFGPDDDDGLGADSDLVDFGPGGDGDGDLVDFGAGGANSTAPVHVEGADELSDDVWREVVADIKRRDERAPYRGEPIMPGQPSEPPARRAHHGQPARSTRGAANLPSPGRPRRPSSGPYPTVESYQRPRHPEPTLDRDHLAHDPDLDDEVFAALAGIRDERRRVQDDPSEPHARRRRRSGEPPSLEALARDTEAHQPVERNAAQPAEDGDMFEAFDVVADDGDESADIKARRSGLFKRLFGRKD